MLLIPITQTKREFSWAVNCIMHLWAIRWSLWNISWTANSRPGTHRTQPKQQPRGFKLWGLSEKELKCVLCRKSSRWSPQAVRYLTDRPSCQNSKSRMAVMCHVAPNSLTSKARDRSCFPPWCPFPSEVPPSLPSLFQVFFKKDLT